MVFSIDLPELTVGTRTSTTAVLWGAITFGWIPPSIVPTLTVTPRPEAVDLSLDDARLTVDFAGDRLQLSGGGR
mgnify:CR=1 FL=1